MKISMLLRMVTVAILITSISTQSIANPSRPQPNISVNLHKTGDVISVTIRNISKDKVIIEPLQLDAGFDGALNVYLYEPENKKIQQAFAMSFPSSRTRIEPTRHSLGPGQVMERNFLLKDLRRHVMYEPQCYFLVVVYRARSDRKWVYSGASNALWLCKGQ